MKGKFIGNERIHIVDDYEQALQLLQDDRLQVPDLGSFLNKLASYPSAQFNHLQLFVANSPFFLEGQRQQRLRQVSMQYLSAKALKPWQDNLQKNIRQLVDNLPDGEFDVVTGLGEAVFNQLVRPILGVPAFDANVDSLIMCLQLLIEPFLSLSRLQQTDTELAWLMTQLRESMARQQLPEQGMLANFMAAQYDDFSEDDKMALVLTLYAAVAPLAQSISNAIALLAEDHAEIDEVNRFIEQLASYWPQIAAPHYIHRTALTDIDSQQRLIRKGDTVLVDVAKAVEQNPESAEYVRSFSFGHGHHFCLGAALSKQVLTLLLPELYQRYGCLSVVRKEVDKSNHIAQALSLLVVNRRA